MGIESVKEEIKKMLSRNPNGVKKEKVIENLSSKGFEEVVVIVAIEQLKKDREIIVEINDHHGAMTSEREIMKSLEILKLRR